jgi:TonB family protein
MKDEDVSRSNGNYKRAHRATREHAMSAGDRELSCLLAIWKAPDVPASLDQRMLFTFRKQSSQGLVFDATVNNGLPGLELLATQEVNTMKECSTCLEQFASKFVFCPIDGTPLGDSVIDQSTSIVTNSDATTSRSDEVKSAFPFVSSGTYNLTIIEDEGLVRRLFTELSESARQSRLTWPEFKHDPIGFTRRSIAAYSSMVWRFLSGPNVAVACLVAILFMMTTVIGLVWLDRHRAQSIARRDSQRDDLVFEGMITDIPDPQKPDAGAPGLNKGNGGGSKPEKERPGGGGGGGRNEQLAASQGKVPPGSMTPPLLAPDPKTPAIKNPALPTQVTIQADPLLFPTDPRLIPYGDPKSKATELSSGQGTGGGVGSGTGVGVGSGNGRGYGPGNEYNTGGGPGKEGGGGKGGTDGGINYDRTFKPNEVNQKARILSKPSPEYTEDARKNQVTGTVTLQMIFSASGSVTSIRTISGLPHGLTERAIAAAQRIKFAPAMKDGRAVSQYIRVEYNFNIY